MVDILRKKRASNKIIDDIMIDARRLSSEALEMMSQANEKSAKAEEHTIYSRESARLRQKLVTTIKKVNQEHESLINLFKLKSDKKYDKARNEHESLINLFRLKSNKKYDKARSDVVTISTKLKEQHFIWHTRLCVRHW